MSGTVFAYSVGWPEREREGRGGGGEGVYVTDYGKCALMKHCDQPPHTLDQPKLMILYRHYSN